MVMAAAAKRSHDWRLVPLAGGTWIGAWAGTSGEDTAVWTCCLGLILVPVLYRLWLPGVFGVLGCVVLAVMSGLVADQRQTSAVAELAASRATVRAEVRIVSEPRPRPPKPPMPPSASALVEFEWVEGRGVRSVQSVPALVTASGDKAEQLLALATGARYVISGRLAATEPSDSRVAILRTHQILDQVGEPGLLDNVASSMRSGLRAAVSRSPAEQRALVPSLVVGDTSRVDDAMAQDFRDTGLTHLMAVSGANLALMLGVVLALLRALGVRGWSVRMAAVGGVVMFVIICGPEPSVQRAAVMGLVALASTGVGKGRRSVRALSVAVIALMALDPWLSRAPGFWLSVSACLGIVTLGSPWIEAMTRWAPRWIAEGLAIPLSAQIATQPIVTSLSGELALVGVLTNVVAGPFVGPTTVLGFAAASLSFLPLLSGALGWLSGWAAQPILWIAAIGADLPASTMEWEPGPFGVGLMVLLCVAAAVLFGSVLRRVWATALVVVMLATAVMVKPNPPGWPGEWSVAFCDVGQGDATVLRVDASSAVLVDTGGEPKPVIECLQSLGVRSLAMIVLTHYHADHVGGFEGVVAAYPPALVLTSAAPSPLEAAQEVRRHSPAPVREAMAGESLRIGDVDWRTISAPQLHSGSAQLEGESAAENDTSVIAVARTRETSVLITGDVELDGQSLALRQARTENLSLDVDVVSLPHHGAAKQDRGFLEAAKGRIAVVSAGEGNSYGHPAPSTLELVHSLGMTTIRTDEQGTLAIGREDGQLVVRKTDG